MGDFQTDIATKNTLSSIDNIVKNLTKLSEDTAKKITESRRLLSKEKLNLSLEKYYDLTQKREEKPVVRSPMIPSAPDYQVTMPAPQAARPIDLEDEKEDEGKPSITPPASPGTAPGTAPPILPPPPSMLPQDGSNGKMNRDQLTAVGSLAHPTDGGPYWYGRTAYLRHDAAQQFKKAQEDAKKQGITIIINSAYRSIEHQKALQGLYAVVAAPGTSPHGYGIALDIETGPGHDWLRKNGAKSGWRWMAIPNDEVHFEYVGGGQSIVEPKKTEKNIPQEQASVGGDGQIIAVVNNSQSASQPQQVSSTSSTMSLNKNYSNFSEILLSHTTFNVG